MKTHTYRTWTEVDLGVLKNNIRNIKNYVGETTQVMAVVKADAYGHGAVPVSRVLIKNGADRLAQCRLATNLQSVKSTISVKCNEEK